MAKFGIALGSGPRGLGFESRHSDVSSDAHEAAAIDFGLDQAADRLISFGFKSITLLGASGFEEVPLF